MATVRRSSRKDLLSHIVEAGRKLADEAEEKPFAAFLEAYYGNAWREDLESHAAEELAAVALSHWRWGRDRGRQAIASRVHTPTEGRLSEPVPVTVVETVAPDMPFLVASVSMAVHEAGCSIHWMAHPMLKARRENGSSDNKGLESWIHMEVDALPDKAAERALARRIAEVLTRLDAVVTDWQPMRRRLDEIIRDLEKAPEALDKRAARETAEFLRWLDDDHYTFLGYRKHTVSMDDQGRAALNPVEDSGLGLMRESLMRGDPEQYMAPSSVVDKYARSPRVLVITKASTRSPVHHPEYMDVVAVKRFDERGEVIGTHRFLGLFATEGYAASPSSIPVLRRKIDYVMRRAGLRPNSHAYKNLAHILESFPRDELFQSSERELYETAIGILSLNERQQLKLFVRRDRYGRFYSCLVYLPRERYSGDTRRRMGEELMRAFTGLELESEVEFMRRGMARVHFTVRTPPGTLARFRTRALEARLLEVTRGWRDRFRSALFTELESAEATRLWARFADAYPAAYTETETPEEAVRDSLALSRLSQAAPLGIRLVRDRATDERLWLRLYVAGGPVALSAILPTLERFGMEVVSEQPYGVRGTHQNEAWIQILEIHHPLGARCVDAPLRDLFEEAFLKVRAEEIEDDGLNALVLGAGLPWRKVQLLRALCRYLLQTGMPYSYAYMRLLLRSHTALASRLVALFVMRFDPHQSARKRHSAEQEINSKIDAELEKVAGLDADRVLRGLASVIRACVRTNYFQKTPDGRPKYYLSFKLRSDRILELPAPRPLFETFVYSPEMEGIHLRAGKVARGGIRWSDRREDYRTEILGLMKAQRVKNAIIVPVGAKGGFVVKRNPKGLDRQSQGIECYRTLIRGLLDITDNRAGERVLPPADVVRHDEEDPYLVVAADKGTASFSDIANELVNDYGFWMGDAFASGGSHGYDHKGMAITARGAWESVRRHFAEMGVDTQKDPFTVVGIGDMAGDVFGNGMLLSKKIRLVAVFNHRHIFIDPDPGPEVSFRERQRLFKRPRSAWSDYDPAAISRGGGVFERTAKRIELSPQTRRVLGIEAKTLTPNELISRILTAPVDLLWNGGIGTYVKASAEAHAAVGDRSNDAVRVDARDLRCKVVGEGGNLGMTQRARVEYARTGGRLNTDFVDNAGGVACSDLEVNIKIPLNELMRRGEMEAAERDALLARMQKDVGRQVLADNRAQGLILSLLERVSVSRLDEQSHLIRHLERRGVLDRALEYLPDEETLGERRAAAEGLTRPELSILLAYSKIALYRSLGESDLPDDPHFESLLMAYFPPAMRDAFRDVLRQHNLRREIIATRLTNEMVNRMGIAFPHRVAVDQGVDAEHVVWAYVVASELFDGSGWWHAIEAATRLTLDTRYELMRQVMGLLKQAILWLMDRAEGVPVQQAVARYRPGVDQLMGAFPRVLHGTYRQRWEARRQSLREKSVPAALSRHLASIPMLVSALDLAELAEQCKCAPLTVSQVHFMLGECLNMPWLLESVAALQAAGRWEAIARGEMRRDIMRLHAKLTRRILSEQDKNAAPRQLVEKWLQRGGRRVDFALGRLEEMRAAQLQNFSALSVAVAELRSLADT